MKDSALLTGAVADLGAWL